MSNHPSSSGHQSVITRGPAGFTTWRSYLHDGRRVIWRARQSRKGLLRALTSGSIPFWRQPSYNWWIGALFVIGSLLFMLGACLSLIQTIVTPVQIAVLFFVGSLPFTVAAFLQNLQAANAETVPAGRAANETGLKLIGWRPESLGWLSTISQFTGTVAFDINTLDAIDPGSSWVTQNLAIWLPGLVGSLLFLISGYFAFLETSHGYWSWKPRQLDWQIVFINLLGCVIFMTSGLLAYIPEGAEPGWITRLGNIHLLLGATCFFISALLVMLESTYALRSKPRAQ